MQDQIDTLKQELEDWKEQARRKDHLLAAALERIPPQLEAPHEPSESLVSPAEEPSSTFTHTTTSARGGEPLLVASLLRGVAREKGGDYPREIREPNKGTSGRA